MAPSLVAAEMGLQRAAAEEAGAAADVRGDRPIGRADGPGESRVGATTASGALANLGHQISDQTVGNILKAHGIEPAPQRKRQTTWKTFIQSHWDVLGAIDFTTIEVWTKGGLVTFYLLFVMELATRRVHFAGCTPNPDGPWMKQIARNLTDVEDGFLKGKRYVLMDRDGKFCSGFSGHLEERGRRAGASAAEKPELERPPRDDSIDRSKRNAWSG